MWTDKETGGDTVTPVADDVAETPVTSAVSSAAVPDVRSAMTTAECSGDARFWWFSVDASVPLSGIGLPMMSICCGWICSCNGAGTRWPPSTDRSELPTPRPVLLPFPCSEFELELPDSLRPYDPRAVPTCDSPPQRLHLVPVECATDGIDC